MSDIGKVVVKRIGEHEVVCRELTVGQLRGLIAMDTAGELVGDFLFAEVRLPDLTRMTNLTTDQIEALTPSELRLIVDACKEANPDFFAMLARLASLPRTS